MDAACSVSSKPRWMRRCRRAVRSSAISASAVTEGQFELFYQPILDLADQSMWGCRGAGAVEAPGERDDLAAAVHSDPPRSWGPNRPDGSTGSCRMRARRPSTWVHPLKVAINLLPVQFKRRTSLASALQGLERLRPAGLHRLVLEITESVKAPPRRRPSTSFKRLRGSAISISPDDFGTGYASMKRIL